MCPLSAAALPPEVVALGGSWTWYGVRGCSTIGPKVPSAPGERRESGTQFIHSRFVLVLGLFQIILQLMLEIIDLNITSLRSERS